MSAPAKWRALAAALLRVSIPPCIPISPWLLQSHSTVWVAVNRMNHRGQVMGAAEKLTQQQALEAITINAAHTIGMADITGSLRAGKRADFTVLDDDPELRPHGAAR